jgi:Asp-tRNAAsn/Glu-tRNAGln amidotransferase A subunit and related amidases
MKVPESLARLTAVELAAVVAKRALSAERVAREHLERIAEREPSVGAWVHLDPDHVLSQARALDQVRYADRCTACRSRSKTSLRPRTCRPNTARRSIDITAGLGRRLRHGVARGRRDHLRQDRDHRIRYELCRQNRKPARSHANAGGSSSGSAAAVADFMVPLALGTQTGGSVIRPASFCGVVGYKPSFAAINRHGVKPLSESLDTVGVMARSVADAALLVSVMTGRQAWARPPQVEAPRIGVWRTPTWGQAAPETIAALESAIRKFEEHGARVEDVSVAPIFAQADAAHHDIEHFEMARALAFEAREHADQLSAVLKGRLAQGTQCAPERYDDGLAVAGECRRALSHVFDRCDALLAPSAIGEAPKGLTSTGNAIFNRIWTLFGVPAITIPRRRGQTGYQWAFRSSAAGEGTSRRWP